MLTFHGSNFYGDVPTAASVVQDAIDSAINFGCACKCGLGEAVMTDYDAFKSSDENATYQDELVWCAKSAKNIPICWLRAYPPKLVSGRTVSSGSPVIAMQKAVDALLNKVGANQLSDTIINVTMPTASGGTVTGMVKLEQMPTNPIATEGGTYDGIVGPGTAKYAGQAMLLAGALKAPPDEALPGLTTPNQRIFAFCADAITKFLNDITANFESLLVDYKARNMAPASAPQTPEVVKETVYVQVAKIIERSKTPRWVKPTLVGTGIVAVGLLGYAVLGHVNWRKLFKFTPNM
jgi:hypothetical protein